MTCGQDRTIRLWNPHRDGVKAEGEALLIKTYQGRHGYDVLDVAMYVRVKQKDLAKRASCLPSRSPGNRDCSFIGSADDNAKFASCGRDRAVFVWDVPTGNVIRKLEGHEHVRERQLL